MIHALRSGSNAGWTNEADLVSGDRISEEQLRSHLSDAKMMSKQPIFVATKPTSALSDEEQEEYIVGCIQAQSGEIRPTFGLFAVDPQVQAQGIGKRLISKIFDYVKTEWKATSIDLWTFEGRTGERPCSSPSPMPDFAQTQYPFRTHRLLQKNGLR